jgi:CubicO group peptidase (beta-lactamase class C family)
MKHRFFYSLIILLVSGTLTNAQTQTGISPDQLKRLDSIATQDVPKAAPGIATGVVRNGKIVYEKVAGYADLTDSSLITKQTRFNIASNGKQFTALAILLLLDEKKIGLDDDIRKYLPSLYRNLNEKISIENLLNHTSGIRDVYDLWSLQGLTWWKNSFTNKDVLLLLEKQTALNFTPGSKYLYSNSNYILLTAIVEKVAGVSFVSYTNNMFKKLSMPNTSFEDDHTKIRGPIAKAYFNFNTWTTYNWIWNVYGDGNIFSTLEDQLRWEQILQGAIKSNIKQHILEQSQQLTQSSTIKNYGYGLEFGTYKGLHYTFHEGATGAWKATVTRFPDKKISVITLTNTGKATPDNQTRQMVDVLLNLKSNANYFSTKPATTGNYIGEEEMAGTYLTGNDFMFQFEKRDTALFLKRQGRNDVQLEREAANILHQTFDPDFKQEFKRNAKGEMEVTAYYTSHAPYTLTKVTSNWTGFDFNRLNGKFLNSETNVTIQLKYLNDRNYEVFIGEGNRSSGILISPVKLLVNNYVVEIEQSAGLPAVLYLRGGRLEKVKFNRVN